MSNLTIEFVAVDDDGLEVQHQLPARYALCSGCQGHGTHLNPSIGNHAYTAEEFEREFDDDDRAQYTTRGGIYDVTCSVCNRERVEVIVDRDACRTDQQKQILALYEGLEADRRQGNAEWAREIRMQELMGGMRE